MSEAVSKDMPKVVTETLRRTGFAVVLSLMMANLFMPPGGRLSYATLPQMEAGNAALPFVRRQLVAQMIKIVESRVSPALIARTSARLRRLYARCWTDSEGGPVTEIICVLIWFVSFVIFFRVLEQEAGFYGGPTFSSPLAILLLDVCAAVMMWMLFHRFEYSYDPPTLAFLALAVRSFASSGSFRSPL